MQHEHRIAWFRAFIHDMHLDAILSREWRSVPMEVVGDLMKRVDASRDDEQAKRLFYWAVTHLDLQLTTAQEIRALFALAQRHGFFLPVLKGICNDAEHSRTLGVLAWSEFVQRYDVEPNDVRQKKQFELLAALQTVPFSNWRLCNTSSLWQTDTANRQYQRIISASNYLSQYRNTLEDEFGKDLASIVVQY